MSELSIVAEGLSFPEGPRWHNGHFYFSDFYQHAVFRLEQDGALTRIATVPGQPSGLGWLPDGQMLAVSMTDRRLVRIAPDGTLSTHAALEGVAAWHCNDMVVDADGTAYVGNFGFNSHGGEAEMPARLAIVAPDGTVTAGPGDLRFPNGSVITPDGTTLIVGETRGRCLTAFDIERTASGEKRLTRRRQWADIAPHFPDGICLDEEGCIWVADPRGNCVVRVAEGGAIQQTVSTGDRGAFACMLGGARGTTLYVCTCTGSGPHAEARRDGRIETIEVSVPRAGLP